MIFLTARPAIDPVARRAHVLRMLREYRGSYLSTQEIQGLVRESGESYSARAVLEALHKAGEVSRLQNRRGGRWANAWAVPA